MQTTQPILDQRCVVCHACYDAPCQLKTTSWEGIARGVSKIQGHDDRNDPAIQDQVLLEDAVSPLNKGRFPCRAINKQGITVAPVQPKSKISARGVSRVGHFKNLRDQ